MSSEGRNVAGACCCEREGVGGQEIGLVEQEGAGAETELTRLVVLPDVK